MDTKTALIAAGVVLGVVVVGFVIWKFRNKKDLGTGSEQQPAVLTEALERVRTGLPPQYKNHTIRPIEKNGEYVFELVNPNDGQVDAEVNLKDPARNPNNLPPSHNQNQNQTQNQNQGQNQNQNQGQSQGPIPDDFTLLDDLPK